ncbi:MAG: hypothetical protein JKY54_00600, partial [Flavobacteriales bacterium]|nr:hypothetical protein [Flavobacteriales bacterium]
MELASKTYKLGRAFSPRSIGIAGICLLIGFGLMAFNLLITWVTGFFFIFIFSIIAFTQKRLYLEVDQATYRYGYWLLLELKSGWKSFENAKGLIIKSVRLTDATKNETGGWSNQPMYRKS